MNLNVIDQRYVEGTHPQRMYNVLTRFANYNQIDSVVTEHVGTLTAFLLTALKSSEDTFWLLVNVTEHFMNGSYTKLKPGFLVSCYVFKKLIKNEFRDSEFDDDLPLYFQ